MEYDYALSSKIPILSFIHKSPEAIPSGKTDQDDALRKRLEAFRAKVSKSKVVKFWTNPDELQAQVILSISAETKRNPREGWVRASKSANPEIVENLRTEVARLSEELDTLRVSAPADTQKYSQGDEKFEVAATYELPESSTRYSHEFKMSWNEVFFEIGPMMFEASEEELRKRLSSEMSLYKAAKLPSRAELVKISNESFDTIIGASEVH